MRKRCQEDFLNKSLAFLVFILMILSLGACQMPPKGPAVQAIDNLQDDRGRLGYLEHRGKRHALLDLLDPAYRATCDDPVARNFNVTDHFARRSPLSADVGRVE